MGVFPGSGGKHVLNFQSQQDIMVDCPPLKKMVMLQHVADIGGTFSQVFAVQPDQALFRFNEPAHDGQKCRFTAPGRADDCDEFSGQYRKGKVRQRLCLAFRTVICVMDIF